MATQSRNQLRQVVIWVNAIRLHTRHKNLYSMLQQCRCKTHNMNGTGGSQLGEKRLVLIWLGLE